MQNCIGPPQGREKGCACGAPHTWGSSCVSCFFDPMFSLYHKYFKPSPVLEKLQDGKGIIKLFSKFSKIL